MKKTVLKMALLFTGFVSLNANAQLPVNITFDEPTFTLTPNSYYKNTTVNDYSFGVTKFRYSWDASFGGYWRSGTAYTNMKDTTDGTYTNLYGCAAYNAYNGNNYATAQDGAIMTFSNTTTQVSGFFITNSTYAWKTIKNGNFAARKFGDTTGTFSGGIYPQGGYPDFFKLVIYGYQGGIQKTDSVQFYLADYRFTSSASDYIVKNWQYANCTSIGVVDSLVFKLRSSDNGMFGMNTPGFFSIDNFTTVNTVGIEELANVSNILVYPNPASNYIKVNFHAKQLNTIHLTVTDITGKQIMTTTENTQLGNNEFEIDLASLQSGMYFIELKDNTNSKRIKIIKN